MEKNIYIAILCSCFSILTNGQVSQVWEARYSFTTGTDRTYSMSIDDSSNIYVAGSSLSGGVGTEDFLIVKYSASGTQVWAERFDGAAGGVDVARSIAIDKSGYIYVTGSSAVASGYSDYLTIKYDSNGDTIWTARYNGAGNKQDIAYSIAVDDSGNAYVTGSSEGTLGTHGIFEDFATVKYDSSGNQVWARGYNGPGGDFDAAYSIDVDESGNVVVTGESGGGSTGSADPYQDYASILYNSAGATVWTNRYNGTITTSGDKANQVKFDRWGNVYVTGSSEGITSSDDYLTIKYNSTGSIAWSARYNGLGNDNDEASSLAVDDSGNVFVTGFTYSGLAGGFDISSVKYDSSGTEMWVMHYNGSGSGIDKGTWIEVDTLSNVYVCGESESSTTSSDYITIKYNPAGSLSWSILYTNSSGAGSADVPSCLRLDKDGNVYVSGMSALDCATVKYSQTTGIGKPGQYSSMVNVFPNPGTGEFYFEGSLFGAQLEIYNVTGQIIHKTLLLNSRELVNLKSKPSGIYFYKITSENGDVQKGKLIIN